MSDDAGLVPDTGRFDLEADVVVVGGGGCGLTAAIAAAQGGAEVLVLEKQARPWCNTARSGGMIPAAGTRLQRAAGIVETPEAMAEDILRKNGRASDPETTRPSLPGAPPASSSGWSTRWAWPSPSSATSSIRGTRSSACTRRPAGPARRCGRISAGRWRRTPAPS